jgi:hypothetical protein
LEFIHSVLIISAEEVKEESGKSSKITQKLEIILPPDYVVYSPQCKILKMNPFEPEVMNIFKRKNYEPCSKKRPLTSIEQNFDDNTVKVLYHSKNEVDYEFYSTLSCCYEEISRGKYDKDVV